MSTVLAFDIGIKNLAWCCLRLQDGKYQIIGWDNYNLLSDSSNVEPLKKNTCTHCKAKGIYEHKGSLFCVRHSPLPALRDLSGNLLKKIPVLDICKALLLEKSDDSKAKKKEDVLEALKKYYALPLVVPKVTKAMDTNLSTIHDSLRKLVLCHKEMWSGCSLICLENQPAFKNPTMKSVQMLLFATLRDLLQPDVPLFPSVAVIPFPSVAPLPFPWVAPPHFPSVAVPPFPSVAPPPLKLVHAGKKVEGAAKGDDGYKDRKAGSEARALAFLYLKTLEKPEPWRILWEKAVKKSDLADALCMCIDASA